MLPLMSPSNTSSVPPPRSPWPSASLWQTCTFGAPLKSPSSAGRSRPLRWACCTAAKAAPAEATAHPFGATRHVATARRPPEGFPPRVSSCVTSPRLSALPSATAAAWTAWAGAPTTSNTSGGRETRVRLGSSSKPRRGLFFFDFFGFVGPSPTRASFSATKGFDLAVAVSGPWRREPAQAKRSTASSPGSRARWTTRTVTPVLRLPTESRQSRCEGGGKCEASTRSNADLAVEGGSARGVAARASST
mmetsp:Transcript_6289/g.14464  ORF Transcript_6289/g.14464 Transcript_6289/m.14464 type:complete len:248 (+) Transcript_6289:365-1108(+)